MQTIGMMKDGRMLVMLSDQECKLFLTIEEMIEVRQIARATIPPSAPSCSRGGNAVAAGRIHAVTGAATEAGKPICRTCGKPITRKKGQIGRIPKCCSAACLKEFKRIYARDNWRKRHGKTTARSAAVTTMPPNPSDPFLTDEQRKEMMARREKLIAASAQKHAED